MSQAPSQTGIAKQAPPTLMALITAKKDSFAAVATKHLTPEKLLKCVGLALSRVPKLSKCTPSSVLECIMTCSQVGLDPSGGVLGEAYLIPYENRNAGTVICQLILGYRGLTKLATRSGEVVSIQPWVVYIGEEFKIFGGTDPRIVHEPAADAKARTDADIRGFYAVAKMREGFTQFAFMSKGDVDKIRARSRAGNSGPWCTDYAEMGKKTVIRRLVKQLPLSTEATEHIEAATRADPTMAIIDIEAQSEEADTPQGGTEGLAAALKPAPAAADAPVSEIAAGPIGEDEARKIVEEEARAAKKDAPPDPKKPTFDLATGDVIDPPTKPSTPSTVDRSPPPSAGKGRKPSQV